MPNDFTFESILAIMPERKQLKLLIYLNNNFMAWLLLLCWRDCWHAGVVKSNKGKQYE
jgi:hypothetical protein